MKILSLGFRFSMHSVIGRCYPVALALVVGSLFGQTLPAPDPRLLAERQELNQTIWRDEVEAQRHERVFTEFWDRIRRSEDRLNELGTLQFATLTVPTQLSKQTLDLGITQWQGGSSSRQLSHDEHLAALRNSAQEGYEVLSTEWHHQSFTPALETRPAQSHVSFVIHLKRTPAPDHLVIKGTLRVTWATEQQSKVSKPRIDNIQAVDVSVSQRAFRSGFAQVASLDARQLGEKPFRVHPLILYDLNQDGLSEVILAGINTVHWNRGNGKFQREPLLKHWRGEIGESAVIADFDGDQQVDFLCITARDRLPVLFTGNAQGRFTTAGRLLTDFPIHNASAMTAGDIDGDHDLDVYVTQYRRAYTGGQMPTPFYDANDGYPSYLMLNDGQGQFTDGTAAAGLEPKRNRRTYSTSFVDIDQDSDMDLLVVSDFAGVDLYRNRGNGRFQDVRDEQIEQWHNFGMAHTIADFNLDGRFDFYVIGMSSTTMRRLNYMKLNRPGFEMHGEMRTVMGYGNRLYLNRGDQFVPPDYGDTAARTGWSWGTTSFDFDNDGDEDIYVANGFISGESTQDYCTTFWCHDIYTGNSQPNPKIASLLYDSQLPIMRGQISWNGYEHNQLLLNEGNDGFRNVSHLLGTALNQDCRAVASDDLNGDGRMDLLVVEERWEGDGKKAQILHILANALQSSHNWIGLKLRQGDAAHSPIGAVVELETTAGPQLRTIVTGDSFYTQHAPTAHFGLGATAKPKRLRVKWSSGQTHIIESPESNRYHVLP